MEEKVLMVLPDIENGGIATVVNNIYNGLFENKINCDFICYIEPKNVTVEKFKKKGSNIYVIDRITKSGYFNYVKNVRTIINKGNYLVIHVHTNLLIWITCLAAKREGINIRIGHAHGQKFLNYPEWILKIIEKPFRKLNRRFCTEMITCSLESGVYTFGKEVLFVPNFVDERKYLNKKINYKHEVYNKFSIPENAKVLGYAGSLDGVKNTEYFVELMRELKKQNSKYYLILIGGGESFKRLKELFVKNEVYDNVRMLGQRDDVSYIMQALDVYITSSLSEGMSMSIIEAQLSNKPCIVYKGISNINDIGIGKFYKCETFEVKEWVEKIKNAINNDILVSDEDICLSLKSKGIDRECAINTILTLYKDK